MVYSPEQSSHLGSAPSRRGFSSRSGESSATTSTVRRDNEAREIKELLQRQNETDSELHYLHTAWWKKWARYVSFPLSDDDAEESVSETAEHPGPVEEGDGGSDSTPICSEVWKRLVRWYGVLNEGLDTPTVELQFYSRRRYGPKHHCAKHRFQITATMDEVLQWVLRDLPFQRSPSYLFDPVERRSFFAKDERTLAELQIDNRTVFCLITYNGLGRHSGKVGLMNIGNTCYMNSSLQCLLHTPELMHYFLTENYKDDIARENPDGCAGRFADAFGHLMRGVWLTDQDQMNPFSFWSVLSEYYELFAEKDQHDTAELAETVLDALMEDCNRATIPKRYYTEIKEDDSKSDSEMAEECWTYHTDRSSSFITDRFHGQYRILTKCPNCDFESRKFDSFTVLHVGLPPPKIRVIAFTLIEVCGNQPPIRYALELPSNILVEELYRRAAKLIHCKEDKPWEHLCFVLNRRKLIFLRLSDPLERINMHDKLLLYSYNGCDYGPTSGGQKTCFIHQKNVYIPYYTSCYSFASRHEEKREFGYPLVLWLPHDDTEEWSFSTKKRTFQGNLDILEHSLRPFKRPHMTALQEGEEQKEQKQESLCLSPAQDEMECDESGNDNVPGQPTSSLSAHGSACSDRAEGIDEHEFENDQIEEESFHDHAVPDVEEPLEHHNEARNDMELTEICPSSKPTELEMTQFRSVGSSAQAGPMLPASSTVEEEGEDDERGETDILIGDLFKEGDEDLSEMTFMPSNHSGYRASCSSSRSLAAGGTSSATEAYSLCESNSSPRADEARTIVIDWDSNAEQHYNLRKLEQPVLDKTAEGFEDRRHKVLESCTLHDCLTHEFKPHPCALDGDNLWQCGRCKEMVNGIKSMRLWKTPDILLIGLKRFDYCEALDRLIKLKQLVEFPLAGLDLSEYYAPQLEDNPVYDLYGVCHHLGDGPKVGHYTSCVKSPGGKWHKFNDSWVTDIDAHSVLSQDAYLLYYRKRDLPCPSEEEILETLKAKERRQLEKQAVQFYESKTGASFASISDDETVSSGIHARHQFGKEACNGRVENGSSSSNEMNNENDVSSLPIDNHGSSSALSLTPTPRLEASKDRRGASSSSHQENGTSVFIATEQGQVFASVWGEQNDDNHIDNWNGQTGPGLDAGSGLSLDSDDVDNVWKGNSKTGTVQVSEEYESHMYTSFQDDSHTS